MSYYEQKYLKYKSKYLNLRNSMIGGDVPKLSEDNIKDLIAHNELLNKQIEIGRTKGVLTFNKMRNESVEKLVSKGIPMEIIVNSNLYGNPNFYKIDDKIKADNIKQYKDALPKLKSLKLKIDEHDKAFEYDRLHGSKKTYIPLPEHEQYSKLEIQTNNYKKWLDYHNIII